MKKLPSYAYLAFYCWVIVQVWKFGGWGIVASIVMFFTAMTVGWLAESLEEEKLEAAHRKKLIGMERQARNQLYDLVVKLLMRDGSEKSLELARELKRMQAELDELPE